MASTPTPPQTSMPIGNAEQRARIEALLSGGDRRSPGRSDEVAAEAMDDPALVALLVELLGSRDRLLAMRAADALEKASLKRPELLAPHGRQLLDLAGVTKQQEVRWHLAQLLPRLPLSAAEADEAANVLESYLTDKSQIVRVFSLQALTDLSGTWPAHREHVIALLRTHLETGGPAVRSRCRRLLAELTGERP